MKMFFKVLLIVFAICGVGGTVYFYINYTKVSKEKEMYLKENAKLQSNLDAIGPVTLAYTVVADVRSGDVITTDDFQEVTIPVSAVTDQTVLYTDDIVGKLYKVNVHPGTILTSDLVMVNEFEETAYQQDMSFDFLPLGLRAGDYIDVKVTLPYGETLVVMTHKRVENVVPNMNVINVYLNPAQQLLWQSALKDKALYAKKGFALYCSKYVEPGVQDAAYANYPIRTEMEAVATIDHNVIDKNVVINHNFRAAIDELLNDVSEVDEGLLQSGVASESAGLNSASSVYREQLKQSSTTVTSSANAAEIDSLGNNTIETYDDVAEDLEEIQSEIIVE